MTIEDFATLLDWIDTRWGRMETWSNAHVAGGGELYADFANLDSDDVWSSLLSWTDNPEKASWPPKPPQLRALALDRMRHHERPALPPESLTDTRTWPEYCMDTYGEVLDFGEAIRRRADELEETRS